MSTAPSSSSAPARAAGQAAAATATGASRTTPAAASSSSASQAQAQPYKVSYISAAVAQAIDNDLMSPDSGAFSIDQLMELAGLACAQAVFKSYPPDTCPNVLVACGPGNQGGDGLVAARHLLHFGYVPRVWYPKRGKTDLFSRLVQQLVNLEVDFVDQDDFEDALETADVVLDAIFGFSFKGDVRDPFREPLELLKDESRMEFESRTKLPPIVSVDIPSAWDVDEGNINNRSFTPQVLISLTAPKLGARAFTGRHFLGGRFLPPAMAERYGIVLPPAFIGGSALSALGRTPSFGMATGSSRGDTGIRSAASDPRTRSNGGDNSGEQGDDQDDGKPTGESNPSKQAQASQAQSSSAATPASATTTAQAGSASAPAPTSTSYFPHASPQPQFDDSQILEITGAEPVVVRDVTPPSGAG